MASALHTAAYPTISNGTRDSSLAGSGWALIPLFSIFLILIFSEYCSNLMIGQDKIKKRPVVS